MAFVYSCCFWFSLRLGGILIGIHSAAIALLVGLSLAYANSKKLKAELTELTRELTLIYTEEYIENFISDPERYLTFYIAIVSVFIITCITFIYGAYACNIMLMIPYIISELARLIIFTIIVTTALLVLKQNTMDIGLLIGASVAAGFVLLGEFYLWVCTANLPILINEIERDEHAATIAKLQQLLQANDQRAYKGLDDIPFAADDYGYRKRDDVFMVAANRTQTDRIRRPKVYNAFSNSYNKM